MPENGSFRPHGPGCLGPGLVRPTGMPSSMAKRLNQQFRSESPLNDPNLCFIRIKMLQLQSQMQLSSADHTTWVKQGEGGGRENSHT